MHSLENVKNTGEFSRLIKNYNSLDCGWFTKLLFATNSLAKLLWDSLLLDSSVSQSHPKLYFKSTNHIQSCILNQPITFKAAV